MTRWLKENNAQPGEFIPHYSSSPVLAGLNVSMDDEGRMLIGPGIQSVEIHAGNGFHALYPNLVLTSVTPPFQGTWKSWRILAPWNTKASIEVDIYKATYANWPPTASDSICGGTNYPTLDNSNKAESTALTGWTKNFNAGDTFVFKVVSTSDPGPLGIILSLVYTRR